MLLTLTLFCILAQFYIIKYQYFFDSNIAFFSMILLVLLTLICVAPMKIFHKIARFELFKALYNIIISPFGLVKFRHFFLADILISFVYTLKDINLAIVFFATGAWQSSDDVINKNYQGVFISYCFISILPFWFRFAQCLVRYKETKLRV
jgi:hypothetical protein